MLDSSHAGFYLESGVGGICLHVWDKLGPLRAGWGEDKEELVGGECGGVYRGRVRRVDSVKAQSLLYSAHVLPGLWSWWNLFACRFH